MPAHGSAGVPAQGSAGVAPYVEPPVALPSVFVSVALLFVVVVFLLLPPQATRAIEATNVTMNNGFIEITCLRRDQR